MSSLCVPLMAQTTDGTQGAGQVDQEGAAAAPLGRLKPGKPCSKYTAGSSSL